MTSADIQPPLADQARAIREEFELLGDWEERFAWLIDMGRKLPPMPPHELVDANKVQGCASQVWLVVEPSSRRPGAVVIRGASDALIVSGLVALVVRLLSGQPADDVARFDAPEFFRGIGVAGALTPQRSNGLASMVARIRARAAEIGDPRFSAPA